MMEDFSDLVETPTSQSFDDLVEQGPAKGRARRVKERIAENLKTSRKIITGQTLSPAELARWQADSLRMDTERQAAKRGAAKAAEDAEARKIENLPLVEAAERRAMQYQKAGKTPTFKESLFPRVSEAGRRGGYGPLGLAQAFISDALSIPGAAVAAPTTMPGNPIGLARLGFNVIRDYKQGGDNPIKQAAESVGRSLREFPAYMMQRDNMIADPANVLGFGVGKALSAVAKLPEAGSMLSRLARAEGFAAAAGRAALRGGLTGAAMGAVEPDATAADVGMGAIYSALPEVGGTVLGDILASSLGYGLQARAAHKIKKASEMAPGFNRSGEQVRRAEAGIRHRFPITNEDLFALQERVARGRGHGSVSDWDAEAQRAKEAIYADYDRAGKAVRGEIDRGEIQLDPYFGRGGLAERAAQNVLDIPTMSHKYRTPAMAGSADDAEAAAVQRVMQERVIPHLSGMTSGELDDFARGILPAGEMRALSGSQYPLDRSLEAARQAIDPDVFAPHHELIAASRMQPEHYPTTARMIRKTAKARQASPEIGLNEEVGDAIRNTLEGHLQARSPSWREIVTPDLKRDLARASALREFVVMNPSRTESTRRNIGGPIGFLQGLKSYGPDYGEADNYQRAVEALRKAWKFEQSTVPTANLILPYLGRSAGAYAAGEIQE